MTFYVRLKDWWHNLVASPTDLYLSQAIDHHDLEYRMQAVTRGEAPFQRQERVFGVLRSMPHF